MLTIYGIIGCMANELTPININTVPKLAQLAQKVFTTGKVLRLRQGRKDLAMLVPLVKKDIKAKKVSPRYTTVDSLVGAAGSLSKSLSWADVKAIVSKERALKAVNE